MKDIWAGLDRRARAALLVGGAVIACGAIALGVWAYRPNYQVLFADLAPRDAAAMTAELDKLKTPYRLGGDGNTILVPQDQVYKLRLKLMGRETPLYGAVGFEVFNNADLGMSEFVQKVNYQRAVQGELTRTIQALDEVQAARVHLAIPEQGLFKRSQTKAKASVTLTLKPGAVLSAAQVVGIQRLVAASVPDITTGAVTVLDQRGLALTRPADGDDSGAQGANAQLDAKRSTEDYMLKKVNGVLDRMFGAGQAIASVDAVLNLDQSKVTTEEVLPGHGSAVQGGPAGVVVRERHSAQGGPAGDATAKTETRTENSNDEAEYQVGRRVEQLAVASGSVKRLSVAVVVRHPLRGAQADELKELLASAVGLNAQRGDTMVVRSLDQFAGPVGDSGTMADARQADHAVPEPSPLPAPAPAPADPRRAAVGWYWIPVLAVLSFLAAFAVIRRRRDPVVVAVAPQLDDAARTAMLRQVRAWIDTESVARQPEPRG
ncbi:flagellar basal-body MS-ring/collar protein FliF [Massilia luteola]|uniref:flagellar basal-body MS-ring/collar protein FliF n=1 Tax=Massilia luteola TaxID=3081751 RepID=UPI002ACBEE21|nr:flagellar basal-body MS-ring/collar protein FliF [Massilia sp. Gc5]